MEFSETVFISYAWEGALEKKEWMRNDIVLHLSSSFAVFWDRDSISYGEAVDEAVGRALRKRPITVFCICDHAYLISSAIVGSGLHRELSILVDLEISNDVRIVPVVVDAGCETDLPAPLAGRTYLNLSALHARGIRLGPAILAVALRATQAEVSTLLSDQIGKADLRDRARAYFENAPTKLYGNGRNHIVRVNAGEVLRPPQWMWNKQEWKYMLSDDSETFCPSKGVWHWDHWSPSRGMCALGTAVLAKFFPTRTDIESCRSIERGGIILAESVFSMIKKTEAFIFDSNDLTNTMLATDTGSDVMDQLLL